MDEKNINISKSEEELLEIMENRSHITADQLHNLKEDEECLQACSDLTEIVIEMQKKHKICWQLMSGMNWQIFIINILKTIEEKIHACCCGPVSQV